MAYMTSVTAMPAVSVELDNCLFRLAQGETAALEPLYRETSASVYGFALSILKNTHDAEDILHDCYLHICGAAGSYRSTGKPMAWILTIVRNLCLQKLRQAKKQCDLPQEDWEPYLESSETMTLEEKVLIRDCMEKLTDEEREIVMLHAAAGFKHREIAHMMDMALATVLSKYHRAMKKLQKYA